MASALPPTRFPLFDTAGIPFDPLQVEREEGLALAQRSGWPHSGWILQKPRSAARKALLYSTTQAKVIALTKFFFDNSVETGDELLDGSRCHLMDWSQRFEGTRFSQGKHYHFLTQGGFAGQAVSHLFLVRGSWVEWEGGGGLACMLAFSASPPPSHRSLPPPSPLPPSPLLPAGALLSQGHWRQRSGHLPLLHQQGLCQL
jgi:hypothetical protein